MSTTQHISLITILIASCSAQAMLVRTKAPRIQESKNIKQEDNKRYELNLKVLRQFSFPSGKEQKLAQEVYTNDRFKNWHPADIATMEPKHLSVIQKLNAAFDAHKVSAIAVSHSQYNKIVGLPQAAKDEYKKHYTLTQPTIGSQLGYVLATTAIGGASGALMGGTVAAGSHYVSTSINAQENPILTPEQLEIKQSFAYAEAAHDAYNDVYPDQLERLTPYFVNQQTNSAILNLLTMEDDQLGAACLLQDPQFFGGSVTDIVLISAANHGEALAHQEAHSRSLETAGIAGFVAASTVASTLSTPSASGNMTEAVQNGAIAGAAAGLVGGIVYGATTCPQNIKTEIPNMTKLV